MCPHVLPCGQPQSPPARDQHPLARERGASRSLGWGGRRGLYRGSPRGSWGVPGDAGGGVPRESQRVFKGSSRGIQGGPRELPVEGVSWDPGGGGLRRGPKRVPGGCWGSPGGVPGDSQGGVPEEAQKGPSASPQQLLGSSGGWLGAADSVQLVLAGGGGGGGCVQSWGSGVSIPPPLTQLEVVVGELGPADLPGQGGPRIPIQVGHHATPLQNCLHLRHSISGGGGREGGHRGMGGMGGHGRMGGTQRDKEGWAAQRNGRAQRDGGDMGTWEDAGGLGGDMRKDMAGGTLTSRA